MAESRRLAGFDIEVPFMPAAGAINGINEEKIDRHIDDLTRSPIGALMVGSITHEPRQGNALDPDNPGRLRRVYWHDVVRGATYNSMGLPNLGVERAEEKIPEWAQRANDAGKPLLVSVSTAQGEDPTRVLPELVDRVLEAGANGAEVNYSCPNVITEGGGRKPMIGYDFEAMIEVRRAILSRVGRSHHISEKYPPYSEQDASPFEIVAQGLLVVKGIRTITTMNTKPGARPKFIDEEDVLEVPGGVGGLSGPIVTPLARQQVERFRDELPIGVDIISAGGVDSGQEVHERVSRGALMAAGVTVFWEGEAQGRSFGQTATMIAEQYAEAA